MKRILSLAACMLAAVVFAQNPDAEFRKLALELAARRQAGEEEKEALQARAMELLDVAAIAAFNESPPQGSTSRLPTLPQVQEKLNSLMAAEPRLGEAYQAVQVGAESEPAGAPYYALAVNFGLSGPSAVRVYGPTELGGTASRPVWRGFRLVGRIDRFTHEDFFDEYLEVVSVNPAAAVFVTVTGRTDDRKTGLFMAWRVEGRQIRNLWTSDLLEHSSYESKDGVFQIEYCAEAEENKPSLCKKMQRDRYVWSCGWFKQPPGDVSPTTRRP